MKSFKIFIVEDDPWYGEILNYHLSMNPDYQVELYKSGGEVLKKLHEKPDLITIDYTLQDMNGDKLYMKIREIRPDVPVIFISSQEDIKIAVDLMKKGIRDYIIKDNATKELLWNAVNRIRETESLRQEVQELKQELGVKYSFSNTIIGNSPKLTKVFALMEKAATTNINVNIFGETGTGKELLAKAIHYNSNRKNKKFVAVNMGAIPKDLVEGELFGFEKGAFTGAVASKPGKFEEANGGTLFLDEIAELDLHLQAKLLRVIQEREVVRLGSNQVIKLDIRLISATHKNLGEEVKNGNFRQDLYYRLVGFPIDLPPLRERENDILILAKHFADAFAKENKLGEVKISESARLKLKKYHYPGNIRELKAIIELAVVMCSDKEILAEDITFMDSGDFTEMQSIRDGKTLREHINDIIAYYLKKNDDDVLLTAKQLDIGKSTIYKLKSEGYL